MKKHERISLAALFLPDSGKSPLVAELAYRLTKEVEAVPDMHYAGLHLREIQAAFPQEVFDGRQYPIRQHLLTGRRDDKVVRVAYKVDFRTWITLGIRDRLPYCLFEAVQRHICKYRTCYSSLWGAFVGGKWLAALNISRL